MIETEALRERLDTMERIVDGWLEWDAQMRVDEGMEITADSHVRILPEWPTRRMLEAWRETANAAKNRLLSEGDLWRD